VPDALAARTTILLLLLATVALVACGGDSEQDTYKEDFPPLSRQVVALGEDVGASIEGASESTDAQLAADFEAHAKKLGELERKLDGLKAPEDLADEQNALVTAMGDVQSRLEEIAEAARDSDAEAARRATVGLVDDSEALRDSRRALAAAVREL
jgi:hypothetical protein